MHLILSRYRPPRYQRDYVIPQRIQSVLRRIANYPLTVIAAPAGYGKTTSLLNALHTLNDPFAWYEAHRQNDSPEQFWAYVVRALQQIAPDIGQSLMDEIDKGEIDFASEHWCDHLLNDLQSYKQPLFLVIDDVQNLSHVVIYQSLKRFIRYAPECVHIVLVSRTMPPSMFTAGQGRQSTYLVTADVLRFTLPEVASFFQQRGLDLTEQSS